MATALSNTEYNPEQFPGLVIRIKDPKNSALIFSSGKIVCTGARSLEKVEECRFNSSSKRTEQAEINKYTLIGRGWI